MKLCLSLHNHFTSLLSSAASNKPRRIEEINATGVIVPKARYLTKSRYKTAQECPTKLYYGDKPKEYENKKLDNPFLEALANGGFQVGALAQIYYPEGIEIKSKEHDQSVKETEELLKKDTVTIFEAAFRYKNLFVRADIVHKVGDLIRLIEVKAKSFDEQIDNFYNKNELKKGHYKINGDWHEYLYDIAFQSFVCQKALPKHKIASYLMLADKTTTTTVEGLNQRFLLFDENGRTRVEVAPDTTMKTVGEKVLKEINVTDTVALIHTGRDMGEKTRSQLGLPSFEEEIFKLSEIYEKDTKAEVKVSAECKKCEFRTQSEEKKNGFHECWSQILPKEKLNGPFVFDIWNFAGSKDLLASKRYLMAEVTESDIEPKEDPKKPGLSYSQRRWIQVERFQNKDNTPYVDFKSLKEEMDSWVFPLHFIDFETCTPALPFNRDRRPYEVVAFQFSHHTLQKGGKIEHVGQYINFERGKFPNFDFVRALKKELEQDKGTIFRYSHHENTVLVQIYSQLMYSQEPDKEELMEWIKSITESKQSQKKKKPEEMLWKGKRSMVDLCELVIRYYYHPFTNGSNSIKQVLPAVLKQSAVLKNKYQQPIYGTRGGIQSLNFKDWAWLKVDASGEVIDPYKQLPPIFKDIPEEQLDALLTEEDELRDGGAAMTAYLKMQFTQMSDMEREELKNALLRYCELDTLAMVMLYEHWVEILKPATKKKAA